MCYFVYWIDNENCLEGLESFGTQEQALAFIHANPGREVTVIEGREMKLVAVEKVTRWKLE